MSEPFAGATSLPARDRIVRSALLLFAAEGFERTSLQDIADGAGAKLGSMYHFFRSKSALLCAVLETYLGALHPMVMDPAFARTADPIERVFEVLRDYRRKVLASEFRYRCPIGSLSLEVSNADPAARALIEQNFAAWRAAVERCLRDARDRLPRGTDHRALSALVLTVMEGALVQSVAERSVEPFDLSIAQLRMHFEFLLERARMQNR